MKKRILTLAIAVLILLGISVTPASATSSLAATPTASTVYVNGTATAFEAYNIGGNNFFKLRDLAYALNGTAKQFEVGYDNTTKAITLTSGRPYTPDGGEMARGDGRAKSASLTASRIYLDGRELNLTVYLIGGNNFFKLRDLMEAIDVFVGYDNATKAITLDTSKGYVPEASTTTLATGDDAVSTNALIGCWNNVLHGVGWIFSDNGKFGCVSLKQVGNVYTDSQNIDYYRASASATIQIQGEYKVSGGIIYFSNCYASSASAIDTVTWHDSNINDASQKLLETPLSQPGVADDFTAEFEFFDGALLRIRLNQTDIGGYDLDFNRASGSATVAIPTHRIPAAMWPSDLLSPDMPEYTGDRLRSYVQQPDDGGVAPQYRRVWLKFDRTTPEAFLAYTAGLRAAGWSAAPGSGGETLAAINSAYQVTGYTTSYRKGCYYLILTAYPGNHFRFEIDSKREIEGVWPSTLFGNEFRPPAGSVLVGEIETNEVLRSDGSMFLNIDIDFWPGTPAGYLDMLKANGFMEDWLYDAEKEIIINGKSYSVGIDIDAVEGTFATVTYYINLG